MGDGARGMGPDGCLESALQLRLLPIAVRRSHRRRLRALSLLLSLTLRTTHLALQFRHTIRQRPRLGPRLHQRRPGSYQLSLQLL